MGVFRLLGVEDLDFKSSLLQSLLQPDNPLGSKRKLKTARPGWRTACERGYHELPLSKLLVFPTRTPIILPCIILNVTRNEEF